MDLKVIIINGTGGSGKDTFVELFRDVVGSTGTVINYSTIDTEKEILRIVGKHYKSVFKASRDKLNSYRNCLSALKKYLDEKFDLSIWEIKHMLGKYQYECGRETSLGLDRIYPLYLFIHCREPENIDKIINAITDTKVFGYRNREDIVTVLVNGRVDPMSYDNASDRNVERYIYDVVVDNSDDLRHLKAQASALYHYGFLRNA